MTTQELIDRLKQCDPTGFREIEVEVAPALVLECVRHRKYDRDLPSTQYIEVNESVHSVAVPLIIVVGEWK